MDRYIALIRKEPGTEYGIEFPDFPGCISGGATLDEALGNGAEALAGHIAVMREHGEAIPVPSGLDVVRADPHYRDAVVVLVAVAPEPSRAVRINISMEERLIAEIDRAAAQLQSNRSAFLADAARAALYGTGRTPEPGKRARREFAPAIAIQDVMRDYIAKNDKTQLAGHDAATGHFVPREGRPHRKTKKTGRNARGERK